MGDVGVRNERICSRRCQSSTSTILADSYIKLDACTNCRIVDKTDCDVKGVRRHCKTRISGLHS